MFYCLTRSTSIVETKNVWFIENGEISGSEASRNVEIKEVKVQVPLTSTSTSRIVIPHVVNHTMMAKKNKLMIPRLTVNM